MSRTIEISDQLFSQIINNFIYASDSSYCINTAWILWNLIRQQYPDEWEEAKKEGLE